ncbi:MAG: hypothetical protein PHQ74_08675 [Crocinitomicaceae bacterium]|nr:hypothetical protein [Crocinitomicaceae bacterium]
MDYKIRFEQLEAENNRKDTLLTESIIYFNEIERNLSSIEFNESEINRLSSNKEGSKSSDKKVLFEKIKLINELRIENTKKMKSLQSRLDNMGVAQKEFKELIIRLQQKIHAKDQTIALLEEKLKTIDGKYSNLFSEFQKQQQVLNEKQVENREIISAMNSVFYAIGSEKELENNQVIDSKKKIFSSNKIKLNEKLNDQYFTKVNKNDFAELSFNSKKGHVVSNHPESAYVIERVGDVAKLKIKDPAQFWKFTKYLVIVTY